MILLVLEIRMSKFKTIEDLSQFVANKGAEFVHFSFEKGGPPVNDLQGSRITVEHHFVTVKCGKCNKLEESRLRNFVNRRSGECNSCVKSRDVSQRKLAKENPVQQDDIKTQLGKMGYQVDVLFEYTNKSSPIKTICSCGGQVSSKLQTILKYKRSTCDDCRGTIPKEVLDECAQKVGVTIECGPFVSRDESVKYICICDKQKTKTAENFLKFPMCPYCVRKERFQSFLEQEDFFGATGTRSTATTFVQAAEEKGWKMISPEWHYLTQKSEMLLECPQGHQSIICYGNFVKLKNCERCFQAKRKAKQ